jgi:hypothetical protein
MRHWFEGRPVSLFTGFCCTPNIIIQFTNGRHGKFPSTTII